MKLIVLLLLIMTASLGAYLLSYFLQNKNTPKGVAIAHGAVAWTAIIALAVLAYHSSNLWYLVIFFVLAALGGLYVFLQDILSDKLPKNVAVIHGSLGLIGVIIFVTWFFSN